MSRPAAEPAARSARLQAAWLKRGLLACLLWPLSLLVRLAVSVHKLCFRVGLLRSHRLPVPVLVVGNLIVGGAGKTPTVIAVVALLKEAGYRPGIVSRGYGRQDDSVEEVQPNTPATQSGDEPLLLRLRCAVPVVVGRDRMAAAQALLRAHTEVNIIVSDDGLQHHSLQRDAQVIVFDERGVGNGWLLPAGPLREPFAAPPPRSVVIYNAARASTPWPGETVQRSLAGVVLLSDWWDGKPAALHPVIALRETPVWAAAGMAQPQRFFDMLRDAGLQNLRPLPLPDHFDFAALPWPADALEVIVTEKDAVKLRPERMGITHITQITRVWVAPLNFALHPASSAALLALLPPNEAEPRQT
jgi:tetraacyldisaccharide 4'-kinase